MPYNSSSAGKNKGTVRVRGRKNRKIHLPLKNTAKKSCSAFEKRGFRVYLIYEYR